MKNLPRCCRLSPVQRVVFVNTLNNIVSKISQNQREFEVMKVQFFACNCAYRSRIFQRILRAHLYQMCCIFGGLAFWRKVFEVFVEPAPKRRSNYCTNEILAVRKNPSCLSLELSGSSGAPPHLKCITEYDDWTFVEWADIPACLLNSSVKSNPPLVVDNNGPEVNAEDCKILNIDDLSELVISLTTSLPALARFAKLDLTYSTDQHGYGLHNLYRRVGDSEAPVLIIIEDAQGHVFGALISCPPKISRFFTGNGESMVFCREIEWHLHKWTDTSNYNIMKGELDSLTIGCASGAAAIWLDESLYRGRTQGCNTFSSDPLCDCGDFLIKAVEMWTFV
ncbi:uncharacterized protein LOC129584782 [Paramacrobiotus metropolitanus]|uniref:uncharacterized protein LOC129584782 n=1 Tax=Paramacrobiotus metropolitanus TaxID=2943436 RepID=UPI002445D64B|nr:uncharacterized protein LOC129584782 [Paramacrobiotus metropolitanus]